MIYIYRYIYKEQVKTIIQFEIIVIKFLFDENFENHIKFEIT
jgi:hypothetical protein